MNNVPNSPTHSNFIPQKRLLLSHETLKFAKQ